MPTTPGAGYSVAARYRLDAVIGAGGMGTVWLAHDKLLGRAVALKEMRFSDEVDPEARAEMAERAVAEARAAARLHHHRIVSVYDVVTDHDRPWIVMQHVAGRSLTEVVIADGTLPPPRVAYLGLWLLEALEAAHAAGIIHRDVKPSNVLIPYAGGTLLTDFSIAKAAGNSPRTRSGVLTGSPGYIAPERFSTGTVGPQADLFGLGATLYFALEGRGPFDHADPITGLFTSATQPHPPAVHAGGLTELLDRLLDKNPHTRATVDEAREMIQEYVSDSALTGPTGATPQVVLLEDEPTAAKGAVPASRTPAKSTPTKSTPAKAGPAKTGAPAQTGPARTTPGKATTEKAARTAKSAPTKAAATKVTPVAETRAVPRGERASDGGDPPPTPENLATALTTDLSRLPPPTMMRRRALAILAGTVALAIAATVVSINRRTAATDHARTPPASASPTTPDLACVPGDLRGDGTSVQSSVMQRWVAYYKMACPLSNVAYPQTLSPAATIMSLTSTNDFAGVEYPIESSLQVTADQRCGAGHHAIHLPLFLDPVAIVYNLPTLPPTADGKGLQLQPATVARIFDGEITSWDDEAIKADNPGVTLPTTPIIPVHRIQASVTTQVFTGYLSAVGKWTHGGGVNWSAPGGQGVTDSQAMADYVDTHPGAIGYVYWQFGAHKPLSTAQLFSNAPGNRWTPLNEQTASSAMSYAAYTGTGLDLRVSMDYATLGASAYPLVLPVYEIVCDGGNNPRNLALLKAFLGYTASVTGQSVLHSLYFAPLPEDIRAQVAAIIANLG